MGDGSKSQNRLKRQLEKETKRKSLLPSQVTNMPEGIREHLGSKYRLIFQYYNHAVCEMTSLTKDDMKRVINSFTKITKHDITTISTICRPDPIKYTKSGNYAKYFNQLPEDFDLLMEVDYTGTGRIMVHLYENMCCVVAVAREHN